MFFNPLSANPTKWSNTLKQFVSNLPTNCLSVFDHFVKLALKGLKKEVPCRHVSMHKSITSQVPIVWYNTFIQLYSHREVESLFKNMKKLTAHKSYTTVRAANITFLW